MEPLYVSVSLPEPPWTSIGTRMPVFTSSVSLPLPKKARIEVTFWNVSVFPNAVTRIVSPSDVPPMCTRSYCSVMLPGSTFRTLALPPSAASPTLSRRTPPDSTVARLGGGGVALANGNVRQGERRPRRA